MNTTRRSFVLRLVSGLAALVASCRKADTWITNPEPEAPEVDSLVAKASKVEISVMSFLASQGVKSRFWFHTFLADYYLVRLGEQPSGGGYTYETRDQFGTWRFPLVGMSKWPFDSRRCSLRIYRNGSMVYEYVPSSKSST